jgi:tetratricopeptide (TPR) repeat protein
MRARPATPRPRATWWLPTLVALLTAATFAPAIQNGFTNWDDPAYVLNDPLLRDLSPGGIKAIATAFVEGNYHPLTVLSLAVDYRFWKLDPAGYHATSVALHVLSTLAVYWLILLLTGSGPMAAIASLFFGVHPLHVESVAWISGRKDVLYGFFYFLACGCYVLWTRSRRPIGYAAALACFALSLLAKGMAVALPLSLLAIDLYLRRPWTARTVLREKAPFFALAGAFGVLAVVAQHSKGAVQEFTAFPLWERILVACHSIVAYLVLAVAPFRLSAFYPYPVAPGGGLPLEYSLAPLAVLLLGWALAASWRTRPEYAFCGVFFLVNLALVLQLLPIGSAAMADRYTYVPYVGIGLALALGYRDVRASRWARSGAAKRVATVVLALFLGGLALVARERIKVWRDNMTLWTDVLTRYPDLPMAYAQRAWSYHMGGEDGRATADLDRALSLDPRNADALITRGTMYFSQKNYPAAVADLDLAVRLRPDSAPARNNRGTALLSLGRTDEALADFDRAIALRPWYTEAYLNRALAFGVKREFDRAIPDLDRAIAYDPENPQAYVWRGVARVALGDEPGGIRDFDAALRIAPAFGSALFARSNAYERLGRYDEALRDARAARAAGYAVGDDVVTRLRAAAAGAAPPDSGR